jgi:hypothetical protein
VAAFVLGVFIVFEFLLFLLLGSLFVLILFL